MHCFKLQNPDGKEANLNSCKFLKHGSKNVFKKGLVSVLNNFWNNTHTYIHTFEVLLILSGFYIVPSIFQPTYLIKKINKKVIKSSCRFKDFYFFLFVFFLKERST